MGLGYWAFHRLGGKIQLLGVLVSFAVYSRWVLHDIPLRLAVFILSHSLLYRDMPGLLERRIRDFFAGSPSGEYKILRIELSLINFQSTHMPSSCTSARADWS
jgi:hypothetical protein